MACIILPLSCGQVVHMQLQCGVIDRTIVVWSCSKQEIQELSPAPCLLVYLPSYTSPSAVVCLPRPWRRWPDSTDP